MENQDKDSNLYKIRHSLAHVMAIAILDKYPEAKIVSGPPTDTGFFYGVDFGKEKVSDKDLKDLQKKMKKIISADLPFVKQEKTRDELLEMYKDNPYKTEIIADKAKDSDVLTIYKTGDKFSDLCSGPHVESTGKLPVDAFRLDRIAGAYFKGDESREMLTRIYGTAFETREDLAAHDEFIKEAEKRDHRKLGKELGLFTFSDYVGGGLPLFTPKGTLIRDMITNKIESLQSVLGWQKVTVPHITKKELYVTSGHWDKFGDELFKVKGKSDTEFVIKPMNCPHHTQIFDSEPRSYKDLPVRFSENGVVYRDEQAGELLGLSRVRAITQDDGHCFCTPDQVEDEIKNIISIIKSFYTKLGMFEEGNYWVSLSVHDPENPDGYMLGDDGLFLEAEKILENIAKKENLPYKKMVGDAAFYGPKLDFQFKDALGREWQLGTVQLDFSMPKRFELEYTDSDGTKKTPVMIHRAIAGSLERFMSVMIEHFGGAFPLWLSPVQVAVIPVSEELTGKAEKLVTELKENGFRVDYDAEGQFGKKVREAKNQRTPYFVIVGEKDDKDKYTIESRDTEKPEQMTVEEIIEKLTTESK